MPKGPKKREAPADVIGNAVHVVRIAARGASGEPGGGTDSVSRGHPQCRRIGARA